MIYIVVGVFGGLIIGMCLGMILVRKQILNSYSKQILDSYSDFPHYTYSVKHCYPEPSKCKCCGEPTIPNDSESEECDKCVESSMK